MKESPAQRRMERDTEHMKDSIIIVSRIDAKTFRRFAYFDAYRLKKRYRTPVTFLSLMLFFAVCCFLVAGRKPGAMMVGSVLLIVGLMLPLSYFLSFELSVRAQTKALKHPRKAYTLTLTDDKEGVRIENGKEQVTLPWNKIYGAYRLPECIYLYAHPTKAFLLPDGQASVTADELFAFLTEQIGAKRTQDCRVNKKAQLFQPDDGALR